MFSTSSVRMSPYFWNKDASLFWATVRFRLWFADPRTLVRGFFFIIPCNTKFTQNYKNLSPWVQVLIVTLYRQILMVTSFTSYASLMRSQMSTFCIDLSLAVADACCTVAGRGLSLFVTLSKNLKDKIEYEQIEFVNIKIHCKNQRCFLQLNSSLSSKNTL